MSEQFESNRAPRLGGALKDGGGVPQLGGEAALKHIVEMMHSEDEETRSRAVDMLEVIGSDRALEMLLAALDDPSRSVRERAVTALGYLGDPRAVEKLIALFDARDESKRFVARLDGGFVEVEPGPSVKLMAILEAVGRIGDPRGLVLFTKERIMLATSTDFHGPIRTSWGIATIGAKAADPGVKRQIVQALAEVFPDYDHANHYIINRLPWARENMLDTAASLLDEAEVETREVAARFLSLFGDPRGADVLLDCLNESGHLLPELATRKTFAINGLISAGDRRALGVIIKALDSTLPPHYAVRALEDALERWGESLTDDEREELTAVIPNVITYLKLETYLPDVVRGIRLIGTERAVELVDAWVGEEIYRVFESFIERGDPSGVPDDTSSLALITRSHHHEKDTGVLTHPLMRRYAFPALRARHDWLRETHPADPDTGWTIACIGWLGDPQSLPWLIEELAREEREVLARLEADPESEHDDNVGEYIYAIGNLRAPEGAAILIERLLDRDSFEWHDTNKALRFYINAVADEKVVLAQLAVNPPAEPVDTEVIEAIGRTGLACAVPGLARLLVRRDDGCSEAINALAEIAIRNPDDEALRREIVEHLIPMLQVRDRVEMNFYYQPLATMPIDAFTALVLKDIGTPEALAAAAAWEQGNKREARG